MIADWLEIDLEPETQPGFYCGYRRPRGLCPCPVWRPDREPLMLGPSLAIKAHSPLGFNWGYLGSGPAQLALALLLDTTGDEARSLALYQSFKRAYVAGWADQWEITPEEIGVWIAEQEAKT